MINIKLPYGLTFIEASLPELNTQLNISFLLPELRGGVNEEQVIRESLAYPLGSLPLSQLAVNKKKGVIIVSDNSRPVPSHRFLPYLVDELKKGGMLPSQLTIVVARGAHRALTEKEIVDLVGEDIYKNIPCINSSPECNNHIYLGKTSLGTSIWVFRPIWEADLKIVTGNLDFHRLTGFSAGIKGVFLGAVAEESIVHNHGLSLKYQTTPGQLGNNPIRKDMEEFAQVVGVDFLFNVIVGYEHQIIGAFAGDPLLAHQEGCRQLAELFQVEVEQPADLIITSPGGFPKDINLYQTVKTLQNAIYILKPGGTIILAAQCPEGYGNPTLAYWTEKYGANQQVQQQLEKEFILGAHKLSYFAKITEQAKVKMVTDLPDDLLRKLRIKKCLNLSEAIEDTCLSFDSKLSPKVVVAPYGGFILPQLGSNVNI